MFYVCDEKDGKFGVKDSRDEGGSSLPSALNVTLKIDITTNKVKVVDVDDGDEGYYYFDKEKCCIRFKSEYY